MKAVSIEQTALTNKRSISTSFVDRLAKKSVLALLENISEGCLVIEDGKQVYTFGDAQSQLRGHVKVHDVIAYKDILFNGLVGSGEAYMRGAWTSSDVISVVRIFCANMQSIQGMEGRWSAFNQYVAGFIHRHWRANSKDNARLNIAAHYDLGNDFFELFLDPSMMYSSAIYPSANATLEEAAEYKLEHICQRLQLNEGDHLLEIGTGWGGMAIYAATHYGCRVTTTTISKEQHDHAVAAVKKAGLDEKITVLLDDYRDLEGSFDKLVSIEMIEAVGHQYYSQYFNTCSRLLKPEGLMLIQAITVPDQRYLVTRRSTDFIQRYIFPGGELPSLSVIAQHVTEDTDMQIIGVEDITLDYARTLADWRERFLQQLGPVREQGFDDVFIRMWDFYLAYCEGGFRERVISTVQTLIAKPRHLPLPEIKH